MQIQKTKKASRKTKEICHFFSNKFCVLFFFGVCLSIIKLLILVIIIDVMCMDIATGFLSEIVFEIFNCRNMGGRVYLIAFFVF